MKEEHLARLKSSDKPLAKIIAKATESWSNKTGRKYPTLHDPLAIETIFREDIVETKSGIVKVELNGDHTYSYTIFSESEEDGPHTVCSDVKADEAVELCIERIIS